MVYYKIISETGSVIGAESIDDPVYVRRQAENGTVVRCSKVKAQGVVSEDGSQTYQLLGAPPLPDHYLVADEITQTEYDYLIEQLDIDDDTEPEPSPDDEDPGSDIMTPQQMRERIIVLEAENAEFRKNAEKMDRRLSNAEGALIEVINDLMSGDSGDGDDY